MVKKNRFLLSAALALTLALFNACASDPSGGESQGANQNASNSNTNNSNADAPPLTGSVQSRAEAANRSNETKKGLGRIKIVSRPAGATILLISEDEGGAGLPQPRGATPTTLEDIRPGKYAVHLEMTGFKAFQKSIEVKPDETATVQATLRKN